MTSSPELAVDPCPPVADTHAKRLKWWIELELQWRAAFQMAVLRHTELPTPDELEGLWQTTTLRFAGPEAPHPNLNVELTNCSGLVGMSNLEILIITHHKLEGVNELSTLTNLKSLFLNNNAIRSLAGLEKLTTLEQLYVQVNLIDSLTPIRDLTALRELYVCLNTIRSLEGLTRKHTKRMKAFFCLPNEHLPDRETLRVERNLGIRCRSL